MLKLLTCFTNASPYCCRHASWTMFTVPKLSFRGMIATKLKDLDWLDSLVSNHLALLGKANVDMFNAHPELVGWLRFLYPFILCGVHSRYLTNLS